MPTPISNRSTAALSTYNPIPADPDNRIEAIFNAIQMTPPAKAQPSHPPDLKHKNIQNHERPDNRIIKKLNF